MTVQEQIEKGIKSLTRRKGQQVLIDNLKYIKSELQRIGKVVSDEDAIKVLKKFIKNESSLPTANTEVIEYLQQYIPSDTMSEEEIIAWIHQNIDFGTIPNKMAAMKPIMMVLKEKGVDGALVKSILEKM